MACERRLYALPMLTDKMSTPLRFSNSVFFAWHMPRSQRTPCRGSDQKKARFGGNFPLIDHEPVI